MTPPRRLALLILIGLGSLLPALAALSQGNPLEPTPPVTALWAGEGRLLIAQGATLTDARITALDIELANRIRFAGYRVQSLGEIRTASGGQVFLALHNGGVAAVNASGTVLDNLPIGGERLVGAGDRAYLAALNAGIRAVSLTAEGRLNLSQVLVTLNPVLDVAIDRMGRVWAAEGVAGLRAYDPVGNAPPISPVQVVMATLVRSEGDWLIAGGGTQITAFRLGNDLVPRSAGSAALPGPITDMALANGVIYVALASGADIAAYTLTENGPILAATYGTGGTGEGEGRIAAYGADVFAASVRLGLVRLRREGNLLRTVNVWPLAPPPEGCSANAPTNPDPPEQSVQEAEQVTLRWRASCAVAFALYINGTLAATLDSAATVQTGTPPPPPAPPERELHAYTLTPPLGTVTWQVVAIDSAGRQAAGPLWRFDHAPQGWYATPPPPIGTLVFRPPLVNLSQPENTLAVVCGGVCGGGLLVVAAAVILGRRAGR